MLLTRPSGCWTASILTPYLTGRACRGQEVDEAFRLLDGGRTGTVSLAHAIGVLSSVAGCPAWPDTADLVDILAPFAARTAPRRGLAPPDHQPDQPDQPAADDGPHVDYGRFIAAFRGDVPSLADLAESRLAAGVYGRLSRLTL